MTKFHYVYLKFLILLMIHNLISMPPKKKSSSRKPSAKVRRTLRTSYPSFNIEAAIPEFGTHNARDLLGPYGFVGPAPNYPDVVPEADIPLPMPRRRMTRAEIEERGLGGWKEWQLRRVGIDPEFERNEAGPVFDRSARSQYNTAGGRKSDLNRELAGIVRKERSQNPPRLRPDKGGATILTRPTRPLSSAIVEEPPLVGFKSDEIGSTTVLESSFPGRPTLNVEVPSVLTGSMRGYDFINSARETEEPPTNLFLPRDNAPRLNRVSSQAGGAYSTANATANTSELLGNGLGPIFTEALGRARAMPRPDQFSPQEIIEPRGPVYVDRQNGETLAYSTTAQPRAYRVARVDRGTAPYRAVVGYQGNHTVYNGDFTTTIGRDLPGSGRVARITSGPANLGRTSNQFLHQEGESMFTSLPMMVDEPPLRGRKRKQPRGVASRRGEDAKRQRAEEMVQKRKAARQIGVNQKRARTS